MDDAQLVALLSSAVSHRARPGKSVRDALVAKGITTTDWKDALIALQAKAPSA